MKRKQWLIILLLVILLIIVIFFLFRSRKTGVSRTEAVRAPSGMLNFLPGSGNKEIIVHKGYTLSYAEKYEEAEWVAYKLSRDMLYGKVRRTDRFIADPEVPTGSSDPKDYTGTGYDKGHLCPAADMSSSRELMLESFYMSNMTPQDEAFNRGIWSKLEKQVRQWAKEDSLIYIVTGPVFGKKMQYIGRRNKVAVPPAFYKVILSYAPGHPVKGIGFIIPNEGSNLPLTSFIVSIDSVESATGIDFYPALSDDIENVVEKKSDAAEWDFNE
ncbi:MAG: DNA/RNA non-specific endonuclease [Syntrophothermus sp.]